MTESENNEVSEQTEKTQDIPLCGELKIGSVMGIQWTITTLVNLINGTIELGDYVPDIGIVSALCKDGAKAHTTRADTGGRYMVETKVLTREQFALLQPSLKKQMLTMMKQQLESFESYKDYNLETLGDLHRNMTNTKGVASS